VESKDDPSAVNNWPFLGREASFETCWSFLLPGDADAPSCRVHITGESGIGKSFFVSELICRFAARDPEAMCLYVDVPDAEIDAAQVETHLQLVATVPRTPSRSDPQQVPPAAAGSTYLKSLPWQNAIQTGYRITRQLAGDIIPVAGHAIKDALPPDVAVRTQRELFSTGRFWEFLIAEAHRRSVLIAMDNIQRLPDAVVSRLSILLPGAESGLRLITTERQEKGRPQGRLRLLDQNQLNIELRCLTQRDTHELARRVLPASSDLDEVASAVYRITAGNPKLIWYQLQALSSESGSRRDVAAGTYEETISHLPELGRLALRVVTLLLALELSHLVRLLGFMHPVPAEDVQQTIADLQAVHLLRINGANHNRVRPEHDLVASSVRQLTTEDEQLELRHLAIDALAQRLRLQFENAEYERFVDSIVNLQLPEELWRRGLQAHVINLISSKRRKEHFEYLTSLYSACSSVLRLLPPDCLVAFLNAFQKVSLFDEGRAAVQLMRQSGVSLSPRALTLFDAKFLVQQFDYVEAKSILRDLDPGSDRDVILLNILLNECRNDEAREIIESLPQSDADLDESQCVMLRNCGHLYEPAIARLYIERARAGFVRLRSRFGEATALNNLGVLELASGNLAYARNYFEAAIRQLESLKSNEVYQPLSNLAALAAVQGDMISARRMLGEANAIMPKALPMDVIMMEFNSLAFDLIDGRLTAPAAAAEATRLHERAVNETEDNRFKRVAGWLAGQLQAVSHGWPAIEAAAEFAERDNGLGGMEAYRDVLLEGRLVVVAIQLSPHWRH
jgi:tetratricopeptide (TPR) repeat protein